MKKIIEETKRFNPSIDVGLTNDEVQFRIDHNETNKTENLTSKSYLKIIFDNLFSFFNILMASIAVILILVKGIEVILNLSFLFIGIINTLIGTIQECKSKKAINKLKLLNASKVKTVRDGEIKTILIDDIVLDDIILVSQGDQVPADCIVMEDQLVEVNESLLTGESRAVKKSYGDMLFAGSYILSGASFVKAEKVGSETYIHSLEEKTKEFKKPKSKIMLSINKIIKTLSSISIPLALIVFINESENLENAVYNACLTITYMIPFGMVLLSSISMANGVVNLSKKNILTQDLYSVEALSRIDTLCLDKTGTITDGTMTVEKTIIKGTGDIETIISSYLAAFKTNNQTSQALIKKFGATETFKAKNIINFSSERKYSAVEFENGDIYAMGAPEYLTKNEETLNSIQEYIENGLRVVLLSKIHGKINNNELVVRKASEFALFIIRDNIRPEVPVIMKWFRENDVDIKIISGDNIKTVQYIAKHSGLETWQNAVDMSELNENDNLEYLVLNNSVFARVSPEQKAEIIDILKKYKHIVAMTGDGINDIISLKKADCSIALSNGAQATKNIANLVLLDSNFESLKDAVFEGRRVVNNVQRSSTLFVMKDFLWMFVTIWPILVGGKHILEPTIITLVNVFITGIGSFFLALEPDKSRIKGDFLKSVLSRAIVSGFYMFLPILLVYAYSLFMVGFDKSSVSEYIAENMLPVISICVTIAGFIIFLNLCRPFTKYRKFLYGVILATVISLLLLIPDFFLKNGTEFIKEIVSKYGENISGIIKGIFNSIFNLSIYKTLDKGQWIIIFIFLAISMILYYITDKIVTNFLNKTMFNPNRFEED